jgi:hypothetical protein
MAIFEVVDHQQQIEIFHLPLLDLVGALSFIFLTVTLYASLKAAKETARANMLNSLPIVTLRSSYKIGDDKAVIINSGQGVAVNVKVDSFYQWLADKQFNLYGVNKTNFDVVTLLNANSEVALKHHARGVDDLFDLSRFMMFSASEKPLIFAIRFSDLSGKKFITKVRIHKDEVKVVYFPKSFGITARIGYLRMRTVELVIYCYYAVKVRVKKYQDK